MEYTIDTGEVTIDSEEVSVAFTANFKAMPFVVATSDSNVEIYLSEITASGFKVSTGSFTDSFTVRYHAIERS